jgi:tetratricopeptide (TPR) repeat protein
LERGDLYAAVGDTTRAEQYFAAALSAGGPDAVLTRRLIRVCVSDHRFRAALDYASDHLRRHPDDRQIRFARATIEAALDEPLAAKSDLDAILEREPNDANVHFALATLLRDKLDDAQAADTQFRLYLRDRPNGSNAEQARANLLQQAHP